LTLTDGTKDACGNGTMDVADFYKAWNRLRTHLKAENIIAEYCAVMESCSETDRLHLHCLQTGKYLRQSEYSRLASGAGFGVVTWVREVKAQGEGAEKQSAYYLSKQMANYLAKEQAGRLRSRTKERLRPMRTSRNWGLSMREAERKAVANETGKPYSNSASGASDAELKPWAVIEALKGGSFRVEGAEEEYTDFRLWEPNGLPDLSEAGLLPLQPERS
jgi:hypothetical protein